jgi:hypothetical protein
MADAYIRHGGGAHFMRPDRVYRTGVLAPMMGYQPQYDVNAVALEFTQGAARGMMLQGLGAFSMPGPIQRFFMRIKAAVAQYKAEKLMQAAARSPGSASPPFVPPQIQGLGMPGPMQAMALQISPHLATQMTRVMALTGQRAGNDFPAGQATALIGRSPYYWSR